MGLKIILHREEYDDAEAAFQARAAICAMRGGRLWFASINRRSGWKV
ncbi:MAG TPA: hypothetical protein VGO96_03345 [Pyrinomonadaceae bacterium]|nr:hypothetical protein [Pyrinomonadaceae bacterium]